MGQLRRAVAFPAGAKRRAGIQGLPAQRMQLRTPDLRAPTRACPGMWGKLARLPVFLSRFPGRSEAESRDRGAAGSKDAAPDPGSSCADAGGEADYCTFAGGLMLS